LVIIDVISLGWGECTPVDGVGKFSDAHGGGRLDERTLRDAPSGCLELLDETCP
jgi:hypothetical protein